MSLLTNRAYLALRKFVDWDIDRNYRLSIFLIFLPVLAAIAADRGNLPAGILYWPLASAISLGLLAFVIWRFYRHGSLLTLKSDEHYDRVTKHKLPHEYADTMSATEARRIRKRKRS